MNAGGRGKGIQRLPCGCTYRAVFLMLIRALETGAGGIRQTEADAKRCYFDSLITASASSPNSTASFALDLLRRLLMVPTLRYPFSAAS